MAIVSKEELQAVDFRVIDLMAEARRFAERFPVTADWETMQRLIAEEAVEVMLARESGDILHEMMDLLFATFSRIQTGMSDGLFSAEEVQTAAAEVTAKNKAKTTETHHVMKDKNKVVRIHQS